MLMANDTSARAGRPTCWFPLALFGVIVALSVPLYAAQLGTAPASAGWVAYAPLTRTVFWSSAGSSFSAVFHSGGGLLGIARSACSRLLAIVALAYTMAAIVVVWPALRSVPSALMASGGDPMRALAYLGSQTQSGEAALLLPAAVLLVAAAASFALPPRHSNKLRAG